VAFAIVVFVDVTNFHVHTSRDKERWKEKKYKPFKTQLHNTYH
jgi:hypothetical protein